MHTPLCHTCPPTKQAPLCHAYPPCHACNPPPVNRIRDRCKNITCLQLLLQTVIRLVVNHITTSIAQVKVENITSDTNCSRVEKQPTTGTQFKWTGIGQFPVKCHEQHVVKFHLHLKLRINITFLYVKIPEYYGTCRFIDIIVVAGEPDKRSANPGLCNIRRQSERLAKEFVYCGNLAQFSLYPPSVTVAHIVTLHKKVPFKLHTVFSVKSEGILESTNRICVFHIHICALFSTDS